MGVEDVVKLLLMLLERGMSVVIGVLVSVVAVTVLQEDLQPYGILVIFGICMLTTSAVWTTVRFVWKEHKKRRPAAQDEAQDEAHKDKPIPRVAPDQQR